MIMKANKLSTIKGRLAAAAQILAITLLAACTTPGISATSGAVVDGAAPTSVCHATGDPAAPYEELTVDSAGLDEHLGHPDDIIPVPASGCPATQVTIIDGKITICHATGSLVNPYNEITVSVNGLNGHGDHEGDLIPAPDEGCPDTPVTPTPETSAPGAAGGDKITICHATGSMINPYNEITVSVNGLNGHGDHEGDLIPAPDEGCPDTPVTPAPGMSTPGAAGGDKITICHATGSKKNPYNEITVSVNGLNGHGGHAGDIIPAPAGGCPGS